ncbi:CGNR zinc finger domain-containing protein [Streptomyces huiliensis]|uniref:CGNR zinc finger domain-containing protein n=1 Tax=Streptomyces huiliensis TaxID=2876027 RepID=UPI001CBB8235|nr:CGNR zinc finger domain-containing protein [Streptomyces huiliensis]MBZ4323992.1 CGNR zinc finger domain-containing protein [Streptomyces huiliensis]
MLINHDTGCALNAVVDLLNSSPAGPPDAGAPGAAGNDGLPDVAALRAFVERHDISGVGQLDEGDLRAVRELRARFARVFDTEATAEAAELLNALVAEAGTTPRLTDHDGYDWHVHYFAPGASLAEHLAADGGMALTFLLVAGERERLRRCGAPGCGRAFVDLSRNRSRRYCDGRTCGNRLHVAAYRARRRGAAD